MKKTSQVRLNNVELSIIQDALFLYTSNLRNMDRLEYFDDKVLNERLNNSEILLCKIDMEMTKRRS